jgi:hypothetical protein
MPDTPPENNPKVRYAFGPTFNIHLVGPHIEFDLPDDIVNILNTALCRTGDNPDEMFRKALALYEVAAAAKDEGNGLAVVGPDGEVVRDIKGF